MGRQQIKIAIDLDDVLFDFIGYFFKWHNQNYGTTLKPQDMVYDTIWEVWGGTKQDARQRIPRFFDEIDMLVMEPIPGAVETLNDLKDQFQLNIVSARQTSALANSQAWIDKYFSNVFDEIVLGIGNQMSDGKRLTKADICQKMSIRTLVDDQLVHARECAKLGIDTILFGSHGWNQADILPPQTTRVRDWFEVGETLQSKR